MKKNSHVHKTWFLRRASLQEGKTTTIKQKILSELQVNMIITFLIFGGSSILFL